jgi:hypothetical protein
VTPVYRSGTPPDRWVYSTRHTCTVPLLDADATLWLSSHAHTDRMRPFYAQPPKLSAQSRVEDTSKIAHPPTQPCTETHGSAQRNSHNPTRTYMPACTRVHDTHIEMDRDRECICGRGTPDIMAQNGRDLPHPYTPAVLHGHVCMVSRIG